MKYVSHDGGQNLIRCVNIVMLDTKIYHFKHRISLWGMKLRDTYGSNCIR